MGRKREVLEMEKGTCTCMGEGEKVITTVYQDLYCVYVCICKYTCTMSCTCLRTISKLNALFHPPFTCCPTTHTALSLSPLALHTLMHAIQCPCSDKRHLEIMPAGKNCSRFPSLLVIGPQKSGTTALYSFLRIHPSVASNHLTQDHFEEIQFFSNNTLYLRGVEW